MLDSLIQDAGADSKSLRPRFATARHFSIIGPVLQALLVVHLSVPQALPENSPGNFPEGLDFS